MGIYIEKVINNNIISSRDELEREIIVMGRGLGFQKRKGDVLDDSKVEKIFRIESQTSMDRYKDLVANLPWEYIQVSNQIISFATKKLNTRLNQNVYLTLTDHISFVIDRYREGMFFPNTLYGEMKRFYPDEFEIARRALQFIHEATGIKLPDEEAASIAIHLVNAEFNIKVRDSFIMTNVIQDIVEILERENYTPEKESLNYDQLLSNLKYLVHRMLLLIPQETKKDEAYIDFIRNHCQREYEVATLIEQRVRQKYECEMTEPEKIFLTVMLKTVKAV